VTLSAVTESAQSAIVLEIGLNPHFFDADGMLFPASDNVILPSNQLISQSRLLKCTFRALIRERKSNELRSIE